MNENDVLGLIKSGENLTTEFKQEFTSHEKIAKEMIAFANTNGGVLIVGVKDNGKIIGVESEKETGLLLSETAEKYCVPPLNYKLSFLELRKKEVVVCEIIESDNKPHRLQDYKEKFDISSAQVFIRVNDKSLHASKEMIRILRTASQEKALEKYTIGKVEKKIFEILENEEKIDVKKLCKAANISERRSSRALVKLVRAGALMIHTKENGEEFFTSAL